MKIQNNYGILNSKNTENRKIQNDYVILKMSFEIIRKSVVRQNFRLPKNFKNFENLLNYG